MKILLIGIPGSGKTTIAKELAEKYGLCMVKTGEILREMIKTDSRGALINEALGRGEYVDDNLAAEIVKDRTGRDDCKLGFIMDGYPRRASQLKVYNPGFDVVFYLGISEEEAIKRLLARGRADDKLEIIKTRLETHEKYMGEVLDYFEKTGKLYRINGEQSVPEIAKICEKIIEERDESKN